MDVKQLVGSRFRAKCVFFFHGGLKVEMEPVTVRRVSHELFAETDRQIVFFCVLLEKECVVCVDEYTCA